MVLKLNCGTVHRHAYIYLVYICMNKLRIVSIWYWTQCTEFPTTCSLSSIDKSSLVFRSDWFTSVCASFASNASLRTNRTDIEMLCVYYALQVVFPCDSFLRSAEFCKAIRIDYVIISFWNLLTSPKRFVIYRYSLPNGFTLPGELNVFSTSIRSVICSNEEPSTIHFSFSSTKHRMYIRYWGSYVRHASVQFECFLSL